MAAPRPAPPGLTGRLWPGVAAQDELEDRDAVLSALERLWARNCMLDEAGGGELTFERVLALNELQVMDHVDTGFVGARRVLLAVAQAATAHSFPLPSALELLARRERRGSLATPLSALRLHPGMVVELVGRAGVGKTQLCMSCAADVALRLRRGVLYVDTESKFSAPRVLEVLVAQLRGGGLDVAAANAAALAAAERVVVFSPKSPLRLAQLVSEGLDRAMVEHDVGLVVLDSIAALTRVTGPSTGRFDDRNVRQSELVARIAQRLKWIAEACDVPVLVTNQVMDARGAQDRPRGGHHLMETADCFALADATAAAGAAPAAQLSSWVLPALGNTWSHCVNVRVALEITDARAGLRRARSVKAPHMAEVAMHYRITGGGVEEVVSQATTSSSS